jgi:23S rRNA (adenine2503-C2)-methyltransferase
MGLIIHAHAYYLTRNISIDVYTSCSLLKKIHRIFLPKYFFIYFNYLNNFVKGEYFKNNRSIITLDAGIIITMDFDRLEEILKTEKPYRREQVWKAVFNDLLTEWGDATTLPIELRRMLDKAFPLAIKGTAYRSGEGNAVKAVVEMDDGVFVESVLMQHRDGRNTVCVSSQAGCQLNCLFCHTGKLGFKRNLEYSEIISQVLFFARYLGQKEQAITNIVFMGMGEPFLNYTQVTRAVGVLNDSKGLNIGARRISVSTAGIPEKIRDFAGEGLQVNLAVSLNAPNDTLRSKIMPVNLTYPISGLLESVKHYIGITNRKVMIEYVLIEGLNDSENNAEELSLLLKGMLCFVNLIPYNGDLPLKAPTAQKISAFKKVLEKNGVTVTRRYRFGKDIDSSCGQLVYGI